MPCATSSATDVQSLTTKPRNRHSPRSTVFVSHGFAELGTPPISLNADMTEPTPASTAAL
jgi:hypothetical protein